MKKTKKSNVVKKEVVQRLARNITEMRKIVKASPRTRRLILKNGSGELIKCISDSAVNVLKGHIPLTSCQYKALKRGKKYVRYLASQRPSIEKKRRVMIAHSNQKGSGFFIPLLTSVIPAIISLIASRAKR